MAGFEVATTGRFWVATGAICDRFTQRTAQFVQGVSLPGCDALRHATQRFAILGEMLMQRTVEIAKRSDPIEADLAALIDIGRRCYGRGWLYGTAGNLSVRSTQTDAAIHITASGLDKGALTCRDFLQVPLDVASPVSSSTQRHPSTPHPSAETAIHRMVYQHCPTVRCVLHVHSVPALLIADLYSEQGAFVFAGLEVQKGLGGASDGAETRVPIVSNHGDIDLLAGEIVGRLHDDTLAVLIRHHGIYVWGPSVATANQHLELLHHVFEYTLEARRVLGRS